MRAAGAERRPGVCVWLRWGPGDEGSALGQGPGQAPRPGVGPSWSDLTVSTGAAAWPETRGAPSGHRRAARSGGPANKAGARWARVGFGPRAPLGVTLPQKTQRDARTGLLGHRGCGPPGPPTWLRPAGQGRPLRPGAGRAGAGPPLPSQPALSPGPGPCRPQGRPLPLGTAGWRGLPSWVGRPPPPEGPLLPLARNPTGFLPPRSVHPPRGRPPGASPPQDLPTSPLASPRPTALPGAKAKAARAHRCPRRVPPAPLEQQPPAHAGPAPAPPRPRPGPLRPRPVAVLAAAARGSGPSVLQGRGGGSEPGGAARWSRRGSAGPAATRGCGTELREETRSVAKCFKT